MTVVALRIFVKFLISENMANIQNIVHIGCLVFISKVKPLCRWTLSVIWGLKLNSVVV